MFKVSIACFSHFKGGMELDALKQVKILNEHGIPTLLICRENTFLEQQAIISKLPFRSVRFKRKLSLSLISGVRKIVRDFSLSDMIFFGTSEIKSLFFALRRSKCQLHVRYGTTMSTKKTDPIHRLLYSNVTSHICISEHLNRNVREIIPISKSSNVLTIYNPLQYDIENASAYCETDITTRKLVCIGRIEEGKGQYDIISAINLLKDNHNTCIYYFGAAGNKSYYDKVAADSKSNMIGFVDEPLSNLSKYDVFITPSYGEGFGMSLAEALSTGIPCIAYDNTALSEFGKLGFHLHYAPTGDVEQLAKTIESVFQNLIIERKKSRENIKLAKKIFSERVFVKKILSIIS